MKEGGNAMEKELDKTNEIPEEEMVVYRCLYGDYSVWVRPASMWNEEVERDGVKYKRFEFLRSN